MQIQPRARILFAIATVAAIGLGGCRDDMQPDDAATSLSTPAQSTEPRANDDMHASDAASASAGTGQPDPAVAGPGAAPGGEPVDDRDFARTALASGLAEVEVSRHVEKQSPTADVRALAKRIADDHAALNDSLRKFSGPDAVQVDASSKAMDTLIRSSKGTDLDRAYLQHMSDGHARSIARYEAAERTVRDEALRTLVKEALPKLREHARAVDAQLAKAK